MPYWRKLVGIVLVKFVQGDERDRLEKECKEAVLSESMNRLNYGLDDANVSS